MKVLSIGNSFSQDAHRYLHRVAKSEGIEMKTVNLYIGGCSLENHFANLKDDNYLYGFEFNGEKTGIYVSIKQAIESDEWDVVTLQQVSYLSWDYNSYNPYLTEIVKFVKEKCPNAKIFIHQTWAYEENSQPMKDLGVFANPKDMLEAVCSSYEKACKDICADGIIPCGKAMQTALKLGMEKMHRDGYHATLGAGRYMLALCWLKALTGKDISRNQFSDFDEIVTEKERQIVIQAVNNVFE